MCAFLWLLQQYKKKNHPKIEHIVAGQKDLLGTHHSFMNPVDNPGIEPWILDVCGRISYLPRGFLYTQSKGVEEQVERGVRVFDVRVDHGSGNTPVISHGMRSTLTLKDALTELARVTRTQVNQKFWLFISCSASAQEDTRLTLQAEVERIVSVWKENEPQITVKFECGVGFDSVWFSNDKNIHNQEQYEELVTQALNTHNDDLVCVNTFCTISMQRVIHGLIVVTSIITLAFVVSIYCIIRQVSLTKRTVSLICLLSLVYHCLSILILIQFCEEIPVNCAEARQFMPFEIKERRVAWMCDFL